MDIKNKHKTYDGVADHYTQRRVYREYEAKTSELSVIKKHLEKEVSILDLCCGPGTFSIPLNHEGYDIIGIDISRKIVNEIRGQDDSLKVVLGDAANAPFASDGFDLIICMGNSLGSVPDKASRNEIIRESYRMLKPGGKLILTLENRYSSIGGIIYWTSRRLPSRFLSNEEFGDHVVRYDDVDLMVHSYSHWEAKRELQDIGFDVILETGSFSGLLIYVSKKASKDFD